VAASREQEEVAFINTLSAAQQLARRFFAPLALVLQTANFNSFCRKQQQKS
jgi:hypothetical protein